MLKNILLNFIAGIVTLIVLLGAIYYVASLDYWNESAERYERLNIETDATLEAQALGSEGVELQSKL